MKNEAQSVKTPMLSTDKFQPGREMIVLLLMLTAAFAVYFKALSFGFLNTWDDPAYIINNIAAHGFSWEHLKTAFSRFYVGNYAPLHIVSYMIDYSLWGLNPAGYIFHNIVLHALNGFLLYILLRRLHIGQLLSTLSALLFVLHPVQVESVLWISQRKNVLAMLFFLLSICFYSAYRDSSGSAGRNRYLLALIFFAFALLTKSVAVVLPPILLLYDFCISRRKLTESIPDKLPFILLALSVAYIAMLSQSHEYGGGGRTAFHGGGVWPTLLTMLPVFVSYLRMMIVPVDLSIVYAPLIRTSVDGEVFFALLLLCLLSAFGCWLFKRDRVAFFWYAFIPVAILPVSQIVPLVTLMNDRYLYFPMLGVASCFGLFAGYLHDNADDSWRRPLSVAFLVIVAVYGIFSFQRTLVWRDSIVLWEDATRKQPGSAVAWIVLGEVHDKKGDSAGAVKYIEHARDICRGVECYHALEKLSALYLKQGRYVETEKSADELMRLFPDTAYGYVMKGYIKYQHGETAVAEKMFTNAVRLDPNQTSALNALGNIYLSTGRPELAIEKLKAVEMLGSPSPELYYSMACAESMLQKREDALNHLDRALRLGYNKPEQIMNSPELSYLRRAPGFNTLIQSHFPGMNFPDR
jgi:hypothetical protein